MCFFQIIDPARFLRSCPLLVILAEKQLFQWVSIAICNLFKQPNLGGVWFFFFQIPRKVFRHRMWSRMAEAASAGCGEGGGPLLLDGG